jgi:hypothetical protein
VRQSRVREIFDFRANFTSFTRNFRFCLRFYAFYAKFAKNATKLVKLMTAKLLCLCTDSYHPSITQLQHPKQPNKQTTAPKGLLPLCTTFMSYDYLSVPAPLLPRSSMYLMFLIICVVDGVSFGGMVVWGNWEGFNIPETHFIRDERDEWLNQECLSLFCFPRDHLY